MKLMVSSFKQRLLAYFSPETAFKDLTGILETQTASQFFFIHQSRFINLMALANSELVLNDESIEHYLTEAAEDGSLGGAGANRINLEVAGRVASRLGKQLSSDLKLLPETIALAFYYTIWTELCTLRPMRAVARKIAAKASGHPIFIPLDLEPKIYFGFWDQNGCEKFYLYHELNRLGARPVFFSSERSVKKLLSFERGFELPFFPSLHWKASTFKTMGKKAIVMNGIRASDIVMEKLKASIENDLPGNNEQFRPTDFEEGVELPKINLKFKKINKLPRFCSIFYAEIPGTPTDLIRKTLAAPTQRMARNFREAVSSLDIVEAHICDHPFYESALVGDAVREAGGKVILWPHSSNVMMTKMHRPTEKDTINTITKIGARNWRALVPKVEIQTVSELMLKPYEKPWPFVDTAPLNVIIIAGAHRLGRLPAFSRSDHLDSYRRLLLKLSHYKGLLQVHCKAKAPWEDFQFIQSLAPPELGLKEVTTLPSKIEMANLVFLSVTVGSTALLEGMGRGIPCITINEAMAEDYIVVPNMITTDEVLPILTSISNSSGWQQFVDKQSQCYNAQVEFNNI